MPSDRRLHPFSVVFVLADQLRAFALPGLAVLFTAGSAGWDWQVWMMLLLVPYGIGAVVRYWSFRYRYEANEMVIRSGLLFRNERHVPYARIQNLDAVQNPFHRLLGVVEVRVETGAGQEPEATMRVLPLAALDEMRAHVFAGRARAEEAQPEAPADDAGRPRVLLQLTPRELMVCGFIQNKGAVLIAAAFGLFWEFGAGDGWFGPMYPWRKSWDPDAAEESIRELARGGNWPPAQAAREAINAVVGGDWLITRVAMGVAAVLVLLLVIRLLSVLWALVQLHGFRLTRTGDDLRAEYGLLTRVAATVPLRRIQTVTIREGVLHRWLGYTSLRVDSAGGDREKADTTGRAWLAPIIATGSLPALIEEILPGIDLSQLEWRGVHPRAFRRRVKVTVTLALLVSLQSALWLGWWALAPAAALLAAAVVHAKLSTAALGWAVTPHAIAFKSGWLGRQVTVARFNKVQAVALRGSPFDRRAGMATLQADTAGAGATSHRIVIPYLPRQTGSELHALVAAQAAATEFAW